MRLREKGIWSARVDHRPDGRERASVFSGLPGCPSGDNVSRAEPEREPQVVEPHGLWDDDADGW